MNNLYHPFPLKCFDRLKEETLKYMDQFNSELIYIKLITDFPADVVNMFNREMAEYGLTGAWNFLCFKRKDFFTKNLNAHVDYYADSIVPGQIHSSIILPLEGCEGTHMYWLDGEYTSERKLVSDSSYLSLKWKKVPKFIGQVEINHEPMLTKVDIPHSVTSRIDGSYRTVLSIRLLGNPTFEEVLQRRFDNKSQ
jgi:hypothetical protein